MDQQLESRKAVIVHGTYGSPLGNWFPWLGAELVSVDFEVKAPGMPTPRGQNLNAWFEAFNKRVQEVDQNTVLIGHSTGAVFLFRLLEKLSSPVCATVFVCPFIKKLGHAEIDELNTTFIESPFDWGRIREMAGRIFLVISDNDPYIPSDQGLEISKLLGVTPVVISGGKHLNAESGFMTMPVVRDWIVSALKT